MCGKFAYTVFRLKWVIKKNYCSVRCLKLDVILLLELTISYRRVIRVYTSVITQTLWKLDKTILLWEICWFWTVVIEITADRWRVCWRRLRLYIFLNGAKLKVLYCKQFLVKRCGTGWWADCLRIIFCTKLRLYMHRWFYILQFLTSTEKFVRGLGIVNELNSLVMKKRYKCHNPTLHVMVDVSNYQVLPDIFSSNILNVTCLYIYIRPGAAIRCTFTFTTIIIC